MLTRDDELPELRTRQLQTDLADAGIDAAIISKGVDQYYFSGFYTRPQKRHLFFIVPADGEPVFFIPEPYREQVEPGTWVEDIYAWADDENPIALLRDVVAEIGIADADRVVINEGMWGMYLLDLMKVLDAQFENGTHLFLEQRRIKDQDEIESIREAAEIADRVSEELRSMDVIGLTENQLAAEVDYRVRQYGGGDRGSVQVASGPNSAHPPHDYSHRTIERGDPVVLDYGTSIDGYLSDQCRTFVPAGDPPEGFVEAHDTVREAQEAAIAAIEPGIEAREIDRVARGVIHDAGYEGCFLHVTGHGLGLGIHEPPYLMSGEYLDGGNRLPLDPGTVVTVEPGIYTEDWGIRIEDVVVVTEDGIDRLNSSDHGWEPL